MVFNSDLSNSSAQPGNYYVPNDDQTKYLQPQLKFNEYNRKTNLDTRDMGHQPYYNMDELRYLNDAGEMEGGRKIGRMFKKAGRSITKTANKTANTIERTANKSANTIERTANKSASKVEKAAIKSGDAIKASVVDKDGVLRQIIVKTNDIVIPAAGAAIGSAVGSAIGSAAGPGGTATGAKVGSFLGKSIGKAGRDTLKDKTGYGNPSALQMKKIMSKYVPNVEKDIKYAVQQIKKPVSERNQLVKQVMKQFNMTLPQASKFIKEQQGN